MSNRTVFYNLCKYLEGKFPAETIFKNQRIKIASSKNIPPRCILIRDTGGTISAWDEWTVATVQIITRDVDSPKAYELAQQIFDVLHDRYGLVLPADTVGGVVYPEIQPAQITCTTLPQSLGSDENGYQEVTTNYKIMYSRDTEKTS